METAVTAQGQGDFQTALKIWRRLAAHDDATAEYQLGQAYKRGLGVRKNDAESIRWHRLAAKHGNHDAENEMGVFYLAGDAVPQNYAEANRWFAKSSAANNPSAQYNLGLSYLFGHGVGKDPAEAEKLFHSAAEQNLVTAEIELAQLYVEGKEFPEDFAQARIWYQKAADQGNVIGQYNIGICYMVGHACTRDPTLGLKWLHDAADQGEWRALSAIGRVYAAGDGVPSDPAEAYIWTSLAVEYLDKDSTSFRDQLVKQRDEQGAKLSAEQRVQADLRVTDWKPAHVFAPEWISIPHAPDFQKLYPPGARDIGKEGVVMLACTAEANGLLKDCAVTSETPSGYGFAQAALEVIPLFKMKATTRDGVTVEGAQVKIPIRFKTNG